MKWNCVAKPSWICRAVVVWCSHKGVTMVHLSSAIELYAIAQGVSLQGEHQCFYCGSNADMRFPVREFVRPTFTAYDAVARPGSGWVCQGCALAMSSDADVCLFDGAVMAGQKPWQWSWCVTDKAIGYAACYFLGGDLVRSHSSLIRRFCLEPPEPPFVIVLAGAGRVHQLYMARVNYSRETVSLMLDGERIEYVPLALADRLELTTKLAAAVGKPSLEERPGPRQWIGLAERYAESDGLVQEWQRVWSEPLSRLAVFLTTNKEASSLEYPATAAYQTD